MEQMDCVSTIELETNQANHFKFSSTSTTCQEVIDDRLDKIFCFIGELWGPNPPAGNLSFSSIDKKKTDNLAVNTLMFVDGSPLSESDEAYIQQLPDFLRRDSNLYLALGLQKEFPGHGKRGSSNGVGAIPGFFFDLDIADPGHAKAELPKDEAEALSFINEFPLKPTIIIGSGGGFHLLWLFKKPWILPTAANVHMATQLSRQQHAHLVELGRPHGWNLDSTPDLVRMIRLPGSMNYKYDPPRPVEVISFEEDQRYTPEDFIALWPGIDLTSGFDVPVGSKAFDKNADYPPASIELIKENCPWIGDCYARAASLPEQDWYYAGGIVARCSVEEAHKFSQPHPGYSVEETNRKIQHALTSAGPVLCSTVKEKLGFPGCEGCQFLGKITSPIVLGLPDLLKDDKVIKSTGKFFVRGTTLYLSHATKGETEIANFFATTIKQNLVDDGAVQELHFVIRASNGKDEKVATITAKEFQRMEWVIPRLGIEFIISDGNRNRELCREAIQRFSVGVPTVSVFGHTGWRVVDGKAYYLSHGGGIGENGVNQKINVELGALNNFSLCGAKEITKRETEAALNVFLDTAPLRITITLLCSVFLALLAEILNVDFSIFLTGRTGTRKTEIAAIIQSFFGNFHSRNLPGNWFSTTNSVEKLGFIVKDAILVLDDFCPSGDQHAVGKLHQAADRVFRGQANKAGRGRLNQKAETKPTYYSRGIFLATGEDIPVGESLRGRILTLGLGPGEVNLEALTQAQRFVSAGVYKAITAMLVQYLAREYDDLKQCLPVLYGTHLQALVQEIKGHGRTPSIIAMLMTAYQYLRDVLSSMNIKVDRLVDQKLVEETLKSIGATQAEITHTQNPVEMFMTALPEILSSGRAHLSTINGGYSNDIAPQALGWENVGEDFRPKGNMIGWIDPSEDELYLLPQAAFSTVKQFTRDTGNEMPLQAGTLWKRLQEAGFIKKEWRGGVYRKTISGVRYPVICLRLYDTLNIQPPLSVDSTRAFPNKKIVPIFQSGCES
ncbi:MAG: DUF927 domain-containing protein [Deltaproteobacteria bacterium]|nr:DUF927 domain-containing protein [Deltaproteobacteria bacterium]